MAAGLHLQKIHGILMSLCSDANPTVHFAAANALSSVIDSAGLAFSGYISPSLGLVSSLWTSDSHNKESPSLSTSNTESELPTPIVVASLVDSLVNVLGPDLQHATKARDLILRLTKQFRYDGSIGVELESLRILEHFYLYDSKHVDLRAYVNSMQTILANPSSTVHRTAVDGIYNLAQRDISVVFDTSEKDFEERLWTALNQDPGQEGIRNIIRTWLRQSALTETGLWISRLHQVLTAVASQETEPTAPITNEENGTAEVQDEEVAGFAVSDGQQQKSTINTTATQERLKWQVRDFALECLSELVTTVGKEIETDPPSEAGQALQQRISEIIRLAFLASTASVVELRVKGMRLIDQVLTIFGSTPDPDFSEALLLEQYQAQISSALTPAFGADSSPELAAAAIKVCATFIATGLVTDVDRMGRILKSLVTALDSFAADSQIVTIGDLKGLSTNAQIMIRMSVLIAWAELQVASAEHDYLVKVIEPHLQKLIPLWLSSLQEFARLRFEPDISSSMGPVHMDEGVDVVYASMNRQTLLKFYQESWLKLVDAIASLIDQDSDFVFEALDGNPDTMPLNGDRHYSTRVNYRDQPSAFFFVLFGIAIEALVTQSNSAEASTLSILLALKKILRPSVSGNAMFREAVFTESIEIFGRLALTEAFEVQNVVVDIVRNLCLSHPSAITQDEVHDGNITDDVEQLFELARIIVLILTRNVPNLSEQAMPSQSIMAEDAVSLIQSSLNALVDASAIFPSVIRNDLYACIFHIFATILGTAACQAAAVPKSLPIFKRFLQSIAVEKSEIRGEAEASGQLIGCLTRFVLILSNAQRRESEASLPCAKNTLLAMTILVTTASRSLPPTSPLITKVLDEMLDCLGDVGLAKVSAGCLRSLLLNSPKTETDEVIALHLIPRLLHFATDFQYPDPEAVRPILTQALTSFAISPASSPSLPDTQAAAYCLILPAILCRATHEGEAWYKEVASRILELASADQSTFKGVVQKLEPEQKSFLEKIIRESGIGATGKEGTGKRASREVAEEPTIALKFSFGAGQG